MIDRVKLTHLQRLETEAIDVMREVVAEAENPVMLYSIGKDSSVMLHLARKAFHPAPPPFPFLHVDTTWKFQDMYRFRERMVAEHGFDLLVHVNEDGLARGINPFDSGSVVFAEQFRAEKGVDFIRVQTPRSRWHPVVTAVRLRHKRTPRLPMPPHTEHRSYRGRVIMSPSGVGTHPSPPQVRQYVVPTGTPPVPRQTGHFSR